MVDATSRSNHLALYHFDTCPFCRIVRRAAKELGVELELRDIFDDPQHRRALIAERGRATVPVLLITSDDGTEEWMPESRDIIDYLRATFG